MVPIATLVIYSVVFSTIMRMQPPPFGNGNKGNFTVWLLAGLTAWSMFAGSLNTAIGALLGAGPLLKKIYFPPYTPVLGSVIALLIQSMIELGIYLVVLTALGNVSWTWLLVPFWLVIFAVFLSSISIALAVLNVHFRDLAHIIGVAIQLLFLPVAHHLPDVAHRGQEQDGDLGDHAHLRQPHNSVHRDLP